MSIPILYIIGIYMSLNILSSGSQSNCIYSLQIFIILMHSLFTGTLDIHRVNGLVIYLVIINYDKYNNT